MERVVLAVKTSDDGEDDDDDAIYIYMDVRERRETGRNQTNTHIYKYVVQQTVACRAKWMNRHRA